MLYFNTTQAYLIYYTVLIHYYVYVTRIDLGGDDHYPKLSYTSIPLSLDDTIESAIGAHKLLVYRGAQAFAVNGILHGLVTITPR